MKLKTRIQEDMKNAMRSGAQDELKVIRLILSAIKQIEVDNRISIEDDNQVLDILNKMIMIIRMFVIYHLLSELLGAPACPRFCLQLMMVLNFFITIETE